jgi:acetylornithine deacetylase/succinyl-diaminopimelate desuccinylase-like protein
MGTTLGRCYPVILCALLLFSSVPGHAESAKEFRAYADSHKVQIVDELITLASVPDLHGNVDQLNKNADLLMQMLARRGLAPQRWQTTDGIPVLFGQRKAKGAARTILFYIHYDGQPIDPKRWDQPDPFRPVIRTDTIEAGGKLVGDIANAQYADSWRIYGRAAADDKAPIVAFLNALDAVQGKATSNIKVILDGEEEGGGKGLKQVVAEHPDDLRADLLIILDGPQHASGRPTIFFGARGGAGLSVTVYTAKQSMHSGNYGNWMPDANVRMAQLISSMVDSTGKVVIPGFYSDVLPFSPAASAMMHAVPEAAEKIRAAFGIGSADGAATSLQEGLNLPSFSVHSLNGGEPGGVIAARSTADIRMRLVKENDPKIMVERVIAHIRAQGYFIVGSDPDVETLFSHAKVAKIVPRIPANGESGAWRTDPDNPQAVFATEALRAAWGKNIVLIRTLGGTVPALPFIDAFHVPTVGISLANFDDNQHSENENVRLGNLFDGVVTLAVLMTH